MCLLQSPSERGRRRKSQHPIGGCGSRRFSAAGLSLLILLCLPLPGCRIAEYRPPLDFYPEKEGAILAEGEYPAVIFPSPPIRHEAEAALQLEGPRGPLLGAWGWNKERAVFYPQRPFAYGGEYRLRIIGTVRDRRGGEHYYRREHSFHYGTARGRLFRFAGSLPESGLVTDAAGAVVLRFSHPLSTAPPPAALEISPARTCSLSAEGSELQIIPEEKWEAGVAYRLSIPAGVIRNTQGRPLGEPLSVGFRCRPGVAAPSLLALAAVGRDPLEDFAFRTADLLSLRGDEAFCFTFSRPMRIADPPPIQWQPPLQGRWVWRSPNRLIYIPDSVLEPETDYRVRVSRKILCQEGLPLDDVYLFQAASLSPYLAVQAVVLLPENRSWHPGDGTAVISLQSGPGGGGYFFGLTFSEPISRPEEKRKIENSLTLQALFPRYAPDPAIISLDWPEENRLWIGCGGFRSSSDSTDYIYELRLPGGPAGATAHQACSYLKEDFSLLIRSEA